MLARYCSAECQRADWRAGHKGVCRELAAEREAAAARADALVEPLTAL
jgi:hypothetical protein